MYNCINEAIGYLKDKYGYERSPLGVTAKASDRLARAKSKKERKEIRNSLTERDCYLRVNPITDEKDKVIERLISQYYCGIEAKKELYYTLIEYGVINVPEDYNNEFKND